MSIRKAQKSDISVIQSIAKRVIRKNYLPFLGQEAVNTFIDSGESDREIENGIEHCFIMERGSELIGFSIVLDDVLHLIMIDVPYQHQGYGTALLMYIEQEMFKTHPIITLQTFESNRTARLFYEKEGWFVQSREKIEGLDGYMLLFEKHRK